MGVGVTVTHLLRSVTDSEPVFSTTVSISIGTSINAGPAPVQHQTFESHSTDVDVPQQYVLLELRHRITREPNHLAVKLLGDVQCPPRDYEVDVLQRNGRVGRCHRGWITDEDGWEKWRGRPSRPNISTLPAVDSPVSDILHLFGRAGAPAENPPRRPRRPAEY